MLSEITTEKLKRETISSFGSFTSSSRSEIVSTSEVLDIFISILNSLKKPFYQNPLQDLEVDLCSTNPDIEPRIETFPSESPYKETMDEEDFEYDVVFRMPPKRTYKIILEIKSIEKAVPKFVSPEE